MMDILVARAEELRPRLLDRFFDLRQKGLVQGALLEPDQYWCDWFDHTAPNYFPVHDPWYWYQTESERKTIVDRLPPNWEEYCRESDYPQGANPFIIRILLRRQLNPDELRHNEGLPREFQGHPVLYEVRPPALGAASVSKAIQNWARSMPRMWRHSGGGSAR